MMKTDSGLYRARSVEDNNKFFAEYRVSVIDAVEAPVLTVNSNQSSGDSCTVNFTCRSHELMINSSYQDKSCSPEKETSNGTNTLILNCSKESIICNHSNPVSWKADRINITQLCGNNKGVKQADDTDYDDVENVQKTDSGLYRARSIEDNNKFFAEYKVSVIDAVEAPILTVNSNQFSSTFCTVSFTCRSHELMINSSYQDNRCSSKEVTSHENFTLILGCEESITCNHSNAVSWKEDRINITQLCEDNERQTELSYGLSYMIVLVLGCVVTGVIVFAGLVLYCCCKNKTDVKLADDTDYDDVETLTQKMTGDTWTTVTYFTVGRNQTPS
ncbi:CD48 antigen-like protein [Labeo rohita]|uniref:CD48 antigen-like protein n=1 Tax=Labeo rohita TaxID=84645 RepID=A0A498MWW8_LABRO|nr:CD48 antigen-like protein [Labeo rohita]